MKTGYKKLDKALGGGLKKGEVTIIAGRPGMCKQEFALNIAVNLARSSLKTMIFSNKCSETMIKDGITKICGKRNINIKDLLLINDSSYLTPKYIEDEYDKVSQKELNNISLIIIDVFNFVLCDDWNNLVKNSFNIEKINRNIVINELRRMARDKNVAIILCVNLDRELEEREDHKPYLDDLERVINLECFPDNIFLMYRYCYDDSNEYDSNNIEVSVCGRNLSSVINYNFNFERRRLTEDK